MTTVRRRIALGCVVLLAAGSRLWGLAEFPPGLYPDQAANGEDALAILDGNFQVFSPNNNGRESLFFYVQALTVGLFGVGVWPLFLASALVGIATVAAVYAAGVRLFGHGPALFAGLFLATNPWHVTLSRTGFRAVTTPLLLTLALLSIAGVVRARGSDGTRWRHAVLAGLFTGLGFYTYTAFRAFALFLILAGIGGLLGAAVRRSWRGKLRGRFGPAALAVVISVVVALPLARFFLSHPEYLGTRAAHVSVLNPDLNNGDPLRTALRMTGRTLRGFVWDGDGNPRHNVPLPGLPYRSGGIHRYSGGGAPFLSPLPAALALVGALVSVRRAPWLLLLFAVMLLPAVTTAEGIPHGLRTAGAIPAVTLLVGIGGERVWRWARSRPWASVRVVGSSLVVSFLALTAVADLLLYFGLARSSPLAHYEYRGDLTDVAAHLNASATAKHAGIPPSLVLDEFSAMTVRFLTTRTGHPYRLLRPETSHLRPLRQGEEMIFTQSTLPDASRYLAAYPDTVVVADRANRFGETTLLVLSRAPGRRGTGMRSTP